MLLNFLLIVVWPFFWQATCIKDQAMMANGHESMKKKEGITMKKLFATATAMMFALGLTAAAQAQSSVEKTKAPAAPAQKVTTGTQEKAKDNKVTEAPKNAPAEAKQVEPTVKGTKPEIDKGKKEAAAKVEPQAGKEVKNMAAPGKKTGQETTKPDKQ
jgi:hypothetical protein